MAAILWMFCSNHSVPPQADYSPASHEETSIAAYPYDSALPVQVEKIQVSCANLNAKQHNRHTQESVFGRNANKLLGKQTFSYIICSFLIKPALPSELVSFPFTAFW